MRMSSKDQKKLEKIYEDMGVGDVIGTPDGDEKLENEDDYAPGDTRIPFIVGKDDVLTRKGKVKMPRKKKKMSRTSRKK